MTPLAPIEDGEVALPAPDTLARENFELVVRRLADDLAFGTDASLFVGSGLEYAGARPYEPGDPIRAIHWRLTARTGRAYIRQYEALKRIGVHIVVDTSASMGVSSTARSKHDLAVWLAAALGLVAQRRLSPVAIHGAGEREMRTTPSLSRTDLWAGLDPLRARSFSERTTLGERLDTLSARAERRSLIFVLSDLHDPSAMGAVRRCAQRHECLVVHLADPIELSSWRGGFARVRESETGRSHFFVPRRGARIDAGELRLELLRCGADAMTLRTDEAFIAPLRRFITGRAGVGRSRG